MIDSTGDGTGLTLPDDANYDEFGAPFVSLKDVRQVRALRAVLSGKSIKDACTFAGVQVGTWYRWKHEDPDFRRMYDRALQAIAEELEPQALERAKESDALTMFFLKAWNPDRYREKQTVTVVSPDVTGRLSQQADAIMEVCRELLDRDQAALVASRIAGRLREIWA